MSDDKILLKTCNSCGQQKPFSAFIELAGDQGRSYGSICATCRGANFKGLKEKEESGRASSGLKIDAKARVEEETDKRTKRLEIEESYHENRQKDAKKQLQQTSKTIIRAKTEKDHRKSLEKSSFLNQPRIIKRPADQTNIHETPTKEQNIDYVNPFVDTYISGKEKYKGTSFKSFRNWIGSGATAHASSSKLNKKNNKTITEKLEEKFSPPSSPSSKNK